MHDLLFIVLFSFFLLPIAELSEIAILRITFGLFFVALLPGYTAIAAVFPGRDDLEWLERLGLSLVLSISLVFLTATVLNYSPWGIRLLPLFLSLISLVLLGCLVAFWRRQQLPPGERFVLHFRLRMPSWQQMDRTNRVLVGILAFAVAVSIVSLLYVTIVPGPQETFTEFYLLGPDRKLGGFPTVTTEGESVPITLVVANHEQADAQYRIEIARNADREQIASKQLSPGEVWQQPFSFTLTQPGENQKVEFLLYKGDETEPYRSLYVWITVGPDQSTP